MADDSRSLEETVRAFQREARKIAASTGSKSVRTFGSRRLIRFAAILFLSVQVLCVAFPPFRLPVAGTITSGYTLRRKPDQRGLALEAHRGIDIAVPAGTPVRSSAPGRVAATGFSEAAGNHILIRHLFGFSTYYAHLQSLSVSEGAWSLFNILPLGRAGSTGRSTGSHLHFEIRFLGVRLPPGPFLIYHTVRNSLFL